MKIEYIHWRGFVQRCSLTQWSRWVIAVEKKERDTREALINNDTAVNVSYTMEAR